MSVLTTSVDSVSGLAVTTSQFLRKNVLAPSHDQTGNANIVALRKSPATNRRPDSTIDDRERRLPKKYTAGKKYINTRG